jgi:ABC-type dipeptide/oligopeptide/nickel transport systems, permease components
MRMMRSSMLEVIRAEYIKTARAKGLSERVVIYKHALKNAMIPTTTVIGLSVGYMFAGAIMTEAVFNWNGMGTYLINGINHMDYPAIMGFVLLTAFIYALTNLIVDLLYGVLDPRIRYG